LETGRPGIETALRGSAAASQLHPSLAAPGDRPDHLPQLRPPPSRTSCPTTVGAASKPSRPVLPRSPGPKLAPVCPRTHARSPYPETGPVPSSSSAQAPPSPAWMLSQGTKAKKKKNQQFIERRSYSLSGYPTPTVGLIESSISGKRCKTEEYQTANHREQFPCSTEAISLPIFAYSDGKSNGRKEEA